MLANHLRTFPPNPSPSKNDDVKKGIYQKFLTTLENQCKAEKLDADFDIDDIYFAARDICEWRCAACGKKNAGGLTLKVWDRQKPVNGSNLLLFSSQYKEPQEGKGMKDCTFTPEERARVEELVSEAQVQFRKRKPLAIIAQNE